MRPTDPQPETPDSHNMTNRGEARPGSLHGPANYRTDDGLLEEVFRQLPAGVILAEAPSGRILMASSNVQEIWRRPIEVPGELSQYTAWKAFHADGTPFLLEEWPLVRALRKGEAIAAEEARILRGDGSTGWVRMSAAPIRGAGGEILAGVATFFDTTEQHRFEVALQRSEERFRTSVESMPYAFGVYTAVRDAEGRIEDFCIEYVNDAACASNGLSREEQIGQGIRNMFPLLVEVGLYDAFCQVVESGAPLEREVITHRGSDEKHAALTAFDVRAARLSDGVVVTWTDISERKLAEEERLRFLSREQERSMQLRRLADASVRINASLSVEDILAVSTAQARDIVGAHLAVVSLTLNDNYAQSISSVSLSDKYAAWKGHEDRTTGDGIYSLVCETNKPIRLTQPELESHPRWRGISDYAGRHLPLRGWMAAPLVRRDGRNLGVIQLSDKYGGDFTEEDEAILVQIAQIASVAIENARLYAQAQDAVRAREELTSVVSHDLRNPLTAIGGFAQMLQRTIRRAPERGFGETELKRMSDGLRQIENSATKMEQLISEHLDVARLQAGQPLDLQRRPTDLVAVARHTVAQYQQQTKSHRISIEPEVDELVGDWDPRRLERALDNLVSNAVKYSPRGGEVRIRIRRESDPANSNQDWAVCEVSDQGIGIPAEDLPTIFEWYKRGRNVTENIVGTGVGLASVKQVVAQHGGDLTVTSTEGEGSTFTMKLPL